MDGASEVIVNVRAKPDDLYAFLVKLFSSGSGLRIVSGDESVLKMQLVKFADTDKADFHFNLWITSNGEISGMHFTAPDMTSKNKLGNAVTAVTRALVAFHDLMQRRK
ncbi:hypothetical protein [Candidatus Nitrososphaera evergladensis]|uniref:hypothetical protein n=1 Tax=Candidatus Nitrososphaera evergladensis TaxID=1459637 RepID=UPI0011E60389|nr:hypothetical protein [Candidatus Nitrososphaera evergladensis]